MACVYIDTNLFLDFYRRKGNPLALFHDLRKLGQRLLVPQQTVDEFERNRAEALNKERLNLATFKLASLTIPADMISGMSEFKDLEKARADVNGSVQKIEQKLEQYAQDDASDPVLVELRELLKSARVLPTTKANIEKAHQRNLVGNPPLSRDKHTICDELIWETLLDASNDDLVICSRDKTFTTHEPYLRAEFQRVTGKLLRVVGDISGALKAAGEDDTRAKNVEAADAQQEKDADQQRRIAYLDVEQALKRLPKPSYDDSTWYESHLPRGASYREFVRDEYEKLLGGSAAARLHEEIAKSVAPTYVSQQMRDDFEKMMGPVERLRNELANSELGKSLAASARLQQQIRDEYERMTGGSSVERALKEHERIQSLLDVTDPIQRHLEQHNRLSQLVGHARAADASHDPRAPTAPEPDDADRSEHRARLNDDGLDDDDDAR